MMDNDTQAIEELHKIMKSSDDRISKANQVVDAIRKSRDYRWVGLYDVMENEIVIIAWSGIDAPTYPRFPITQGLNGVAVSLKNAVIVNDVATDARYLTTFGSTRSEIIVPVLTESKQVVGTIDVESSEKDAFGESDKTFLQGCSQTILSLWKSASPS
jgi:L-methionine (R)-S-oxide reductase